MYIDKIFIGSANLNNEYGSYYIQKNNNADEILEHAKKNNISRIDTAESYGNGNAAVLNFIEKHKFQIEITTKIVLKTKKALHQDLRLVIEKYKNAKKINILFHKFDEFITISQDQIKNIKDQFTGTSLNNIGVSIYNPKELEMLQDHYSNLMVQMPYSWIDNRWNNSVIRRCKNENFHIQVRSIFLQGLLCNFNDEYWPEKFRKFRDFELLPILNESSMNAHQVCMNEVLSENWIDSVCFGVESLSQFENNIKALSILGQYSSLQKPLNVPNDIFFPYKWNDKIYP